MIGGLHALDEVVTQRNDMLGFVLIVRTLAGLRRQTIAHVSLCRRRVAETSIGFSERSLVLLRSEKHDNVCDHGVDCRKNQVDVAITRRMIGSHQYLEEVATLSHEMLCYHITMHLGDHVGRGVREMRTENSRGSQIRTTPCRKL